MILKDVSVEKIKLILKNTSLDGYTSFYEIDVVPDGLFSTAPSVSAYVSFMGVITYKCISQSSSDITYFRGSSIFTEVYDADA